MRELRRSFGVLGEAQWFWGLGGVGGGRLVLKNGFLPWNSDPLSITGALFRSERFYWSLRVAKNGTFQFGVATGRSQYK